MDKNKDGVVTLEEFVIACQEVRIVLQRGRASINMIIILVLLYNKLTHRAGHEHI